MIMSSSQFTLDIHWDGTVFFWAASYGMKVDQVFDEFRFLDSLNKSIHVVLGNQRELSIWLGVWLVPGSGKTKVFDTPPRILAIGLVSRALLLLYP